jgi:hypothetical protein
MYVVLLSASAATMIELDLTHKAAQTAPNFLGVTIDIEHLDDNYTSFINLEHDAVVRAAQPFEGAVMRVGGVGSNHWRFSVDGQFVPGKSNDMDDKGAWVLNAKIWNMLYNFAKKAGLRLLMSLNPFGTRFPQNNSWDSTNTRAFLEYVHSQGQDNESVLLGFEFGNEPYLSNRYQPKDVKVNGKMLSEGTAVLQHLMQQILSKPLIIQAPDIAAYGPPEDPYLATYLAGSAKDLAQASVHFYPFSGHVQPTQCKVENFVNPNGHTGKPLRWLKTTQDIVKSSHLPIVLSEFAGASGGCFNITDALAGSLWFIHFLGQVGSLGFSQVYRQTLFGNGYWQAGNQPGSYNMIGVSEGCRESPVNSTKGSCQVQKRPDYFVALLWRRMMGYTFFDNSADQGDLRVHVACSAAQAGTNAPDGFSDISYTSSVVVAFVNFNAADQNLTLSIQTQESPEGQTYWGPRLEYILTSDSLSSKTVRLNGQSDWLSSVDQLIPRAVNESITSSVDGGEDGAIPIPGHSIGFIALTGMSARECEEGRAGRG